MLRLLFVEAISVQVSVGLFVCANHLPEEEGAMVSDAQCVSIYCSPETPPATLVETRGLYVAPEGRCCSSVPFLKMLY